MVSEPGNHLNLHTLASSCNNSEKELETPTWTWPLFDELGTELQRIGHHENSGGESQNLKASQSVDCKDALSPVLLHVRCSEGGNTVSSMKIKLWNGWNEKLVASHCRMLLPISAECVELAALVVVAGRLPSHFSGGRCFFFSPLKLCPLTFAFNVVLLDLDCHVFQGKSSCKAFLVMWCWENLFSALYLHI